MSIEAQLSEVTILLKQMIALYGDQPQAPVATPTPTPAPAPTAAPTPAPVPPGPPVAAPPPAPGLAPAPVASPPMAPGAPVPAPAPAAPSAPGVPGITLDQIRDKLNNWWRTHPDRSGEIMVILGEVGVQKVEDIPPAQFGVVWSKLEALGG